MTKPFDHDPSQWGQPVEDSSDKWHRLACLTFVDVMQDPKSFFNPEKTRFYTDASGMEVRVLVLLLGVCLPLLYHFV